MSDQKINPNLTFLLVDDNPKIVRTLHSILKSAGFKNVYTAENGKEALNCFKEHGIDLVFMDWDMPGMTGEAVLKKMQKENMLTHTKVIMLTAYSEKEYILASKELGAVNYIVKPFTPPVIYKKIESVFHATIPDKKDFVLL